MSLQNAFNQALYTASQAKFFKKAAYGKEEAKQEFQKQIQESAKEARKAASAEYAKISESALANIQQEAKKAFNMKGIMTAEEAKSSKAIQDSIAKIRKADANKAFAAYESMTGRNLGKTQQKQTFEERTNLLKNRTVPTTAKGVFQVKPTTTEPTTTKPKEDKK